MNTALRIQVIKAAHELVPFLSYSQHKTMAVLAGGGGDGSDFYTHRILDLANQIETMPKTYEQDGMGDEAIAHLHYFSGSSDWYITEKDMDGGVQQAFGYAILNGDEEMAGLGFISIEELTSHGVELDLHFTPCTLATIKAKRAG